MRFFVVLSVDVPAGEDVEEYHPNNLKGYRYPEQEVLGEWDCTEKDESGDYDYLDGRWEGHHHRKWIGDLSREEFDSFVGRMCLTASSVETMGTLTGFGVQPAISFENNDGPAIISCYATPFPDRVRMSDWWNEDRQANAWRRIKRAVVSVYGR